MWLEANKQHRKKINDNGFNFAPVSYFEEWTPYTYDWHVPCVLVETTNRPIRFNYGTVGEILPRGRASIRTQEY